MAVNCPKMCYTAPLVNRLTHDPENTGKNYTGNACNVFLRDLEQPYHYFGFIREDLRFRKIVEEAKKHAE